MISLEQTVSRAIRLASSSAYRAADRATTPSAADDPLAAADTLVIYKGPETMPRTRRGGVLAFRLVSGNLRHVRQCALACLVSVLLAGLAAQAPTAAAATRAPQGALAINPFAGSINLAAPADISSPYSQAVLADHPDCLLPPR